MSKDPMARTAEIAMREDSGKLMPGTTYSRLTKKVKTNSSMR